MKKHHIDIAKEKLEKKHDVTVCTIIDSGVVYNGGFFTDYYLKEYEGQATFCIEESGFLHIFMPNGDFTTAIKIDKNINKKGYIKALNRILK